MLNNITVQGRLVRDIELKRVGNDTALCSFTIATERDSKNKETDFIDCIAFGGNAEFIAKYFRKGSMIIVTGSLQSRKWQDKQGNNRINWEINVNHGYFCGKSEAGEAKPQSVFYDEPDDDSTLPF